jgi:hypothetical protein
MGVRVKVLNLYAGLGGNRRLWPDDWQITAVEYDENIAAYYRDRYPKDELIVGDAHSIYLRIIRIMTLYGLHRLASLIAALDLI